MAESLKRRRGGIRQRLDEHAESTNPALESVADFVSIGAICMGLYESSVRSKDCYVGCKAYQTCYFNWWILVGAGAT